MSNTNKVKTSRACIYKSMQHSPLFSTCPTITVFLPLTAYLRLTRPSCAVLPISFSIAFTHHGNKHELYHLLLEHLYSLSSLNHGRGCQSHTILLLSSLATAQNHQPHRRHWHPTRPHLPTLQCQHTPHPSPPIKWRHNTAAVASAAPSISHVTPHLLPKHYGQRNNALPTQHTTLQPPIFPTKNRSYQDYQKYSTMPQRTPNTSTTQHNISPGNLHVQPWDMDSTCTPSHLVGVRGSCLLLYLHLLS